MKSNKIFIILLSMMIFSLSSCNSLFHKDIEPLSEISIYPMMEFKESYVVKRELGGTWTEPGFNCSQIEMGKNDLNSKVVIDDSSVDLNTAGYYFISYTVKNDFGYERVFYRTVVVTDPTSDNTDITGTYYQGFDTPTAPTMDVEHQGEDSDFYFASNIETENDVISSTLINMGNNKYCVPRVWTEYAGGNYVDGFAEYVEVGGFVPSKKLYFSLTFTKKDGNKFLQTQYIDDNGFPVDRRVIWTKRD